MKGNIEMNINYGLLALLEAKPGKAPELAAFLEQGARLAKQEPRTATWYAFKVNDTTYGVFDTFNDEAGRAAHLNGPIAAALLEVAPDLLAAAPEFRPLEMVATK
jgi:quinol monooxygenase YgiN